MKVTNVEEQPHYMVNLSARARRVQKIQTAELQSKFMPIANALAPPPTAKPAEEQKRISAYPVKVEMEVKPENNQGLKLDIKSVEPETNS